MTQPLRQPLAPRPASAALTDEEVVARVRAGDASLFEILMRRYNQRLFRVVRGILADDHEAEDVLQEAYVRAFHHLGSFRGEARFATWLTRIAAHEALARSRKRRRLVAIDNAGGSAEQTSSSDSGPPDRPDFVAENHELQAALSAAVEALPAPLRAVFVLREIEGLSTEETAEALEISAENARVRLHRAKAHLRRNLDQRLGAEVTRLYRFDGERCDRMVAVVLARIL